MTTTASAVLRALRVALKAYGVFAVAHVLWKISSRIRELRRFAKLTEHLPGEPPDMLARALRANVSRLNEWTAELSSKHDGAPLICRPSPEKMILCNNEDSVRWMLKDDFQHVTKPDRDHDLLFTLLSEFIGDGIFLLRHGDGAPADHERWLRMRKTAALVFTKANFERQMHAVMLGKAEQLVSAVRRAAERNEAALPDQPEQNAAAEGAVAVDMQRSFFCWTFDVMQKVLFGVDVDSVGAGEEDPYAQAFDNAHRAMLRHTFSNLPLLLACRFALPYPFGDWTPEDTSGGWLRKARRLYDPVYLEFQAAVRVLDQETKRRAEEMRADPEKRSRDDLMAKFFVAADKEGVRLSDKELRDLMLNFIIAGRDTTACLLSWLFYHLSENPEVQDKLCAELDAVFEDGRAPTLEDLRPHNTPYLNGCLHEALRLSPPVPIDVKVATSDLSFQGTPIPKGTKLMFSPYALGRRESVYPDAQSFKPERWIPFKEPSMYDFPVFQAGARYCLGKDLAKTETALVTAMLLKKHGPGQRGLKFRLESSQKGKITYSQMVTMSIRNDKGADAFGDNSHELWLVPRFRD